MEEINDAKILKWHILDLEKHGLIVKVIVAVFTALCFDGKSYSYYVRFSPEVPFMHFYFPKIFNKHSSVKYIKERAIVKILFTAAIREFACAGERESRRKHLIASFLFSGCIVFHSFSWRRPPFFVSITFDDERQRPLKYYNFVGGTN